PGLGPRSDTVRGGHCRPAPDCVLTELLAGHAAGMTTDQLTALTPATPDFAVRPGQVPAETGPESPVAAANAPEPLLAFVFSEVTEGGSVQVWSVPDLSTHELTTNEPSVGTDTEGDLWSVVLTIELSNDDAKVVTAPAPE